MRWQDFQRSQNVEESEGGGSPVGFGGGGFRLGGGALIIVVIVSLVLGKNPLDVLALLSDGGGSAPTTQSHQVTPDQVQPGSSRDFVSAILGDTEQFWTQAFAQAGRHYDAPTLHLFHGSEQSACGYASVAMGPFYCPRDQKVYLDTAFFDDLTRRFGAPGEFARAYVIAHEVGHHVQNQLHIMDKVERSGAMGSQGESSASVRLELQADCFAGVWAHSAAQRGAIDTSDVQQGLAAAAAVGDDRLQKRTQGYVVPESFTHGTSAQRVRWFEAGLKSGDIGSCNTFSAQNL